MKYEYKSKGNRPLIEENRKVKYGLRKLSIGVVSCVLGCVIFFGTGVTVQAAENTSATTETDSVASDTAVSNEKPTNNEDSITDENLNNSENYLQPNSEVVEENESPEVSTANAHSETVASENNSEVSEEPSTDIVEERSAETISQPTKEVNETADIEEKTRATDTQIARVTKEWTNLTEIPTNKTEIEAEAVISNPEVPKEVKLPNEKTIDITKYKADLDENRYTFAIVALDNLINEVQGTFNKKFNKNWYLTFSLPKDRSSVNVTVNLVDATSNSILETKVLTPNAKKAITFDKIKGAVDNEDKNYLYPFTYSESTNENGIVTRNIRSTVSKTEVQNTFVYTPVEPSIQGVTVNSINLTVPGVANQYNYYKVVDYDQYTTYLTGDKTYHSQRTGNEKDLSIYVQSGNAGQNFKVSGTAEYDKYELVESADENGKLEGTLSSNYVPGTVTRTGVVRYAKRLQRIVNENGDAVIEMWILDPDKVDVKTYNAEQEKGNEQIQTDNYIKLFETPVLKSGEWNPKEFNQNWEDWVEKAGLTLKDDKNVRNLKNFGSNNLDVPGALYFPVLNNNGEKWVGGNWFRLQNDNKPRSDAYYYYVEKGSVIVHYEDTEGNVINQPVTDTAHGVTGSEYNTTDHKDRSIEFNGETYYLVQKPAEKNIQANDDSVKTALSADKVENNKLIQETTAEIGNVKASTDIHLTYVYEKAGNVKVNYFAVDSQGKVLNPLSGTTTGIDKKEVSTSEYDTKSAKAGTEYNTTDLKPETIQDKQGRIWRLVKDTNPHPVTDGASEAGIVVSGETKEINYYYELVEGDVIVHYINEEGKKIKEDVVDTPTSSVGTSYNTADDNKPKTIKTEDGKVYEFIKVDPSSAPETGKVVEGTTEVTYVYREVKGDKPVVPNNSTPKSNVPVSSNDLASKSSKPVESNNTKESVNPKTGDTTNVTGLLGEMVLSLGALLVLFKKKHN
ncbi:gram-positive signal peptide [[Clostridium] sordellii]|uniref:MucBP domain-containing protein n=1 Tax=Paraclostridium sordellii TaxID=1505 RepID=UPI0005EA27F7|nr:MucBP domain-containing protein [Paeniclostridium sordellii]CEQ29809.1 gram-positive signal peptide [[Clostridium] sordellii] [Paeniclostridium sordellii]